VEIRETGDTSEEDEKPRGSKWRSATVPSLRLGRRSERLFNGSPVQSQTSNVTQVPHGTAHYGASASIPFYRSICLRLAGLQRRDGGGRRRREPAVVPCNGRPYQHTMRARITALLDGCEKCNFWVIFFENWRILYLTSPYKNIFTERKTQVLEKFSTICRVQSSMSPLTSRIESLASKEA
jgi:hypothetical protein